MFGVDITDHYVVYDHDKQCRDAGSLYPAIDVELYGKKARKIRMSGCWYPEFLFQSTTVNVHYTQRGNYLHFRLTDYGVKDVRGVFCQVLHKGVPINNKYALDGNYICAYNSIIDAAKDVAISSQ